MPLGTDHHAVQWEVIAAKQGSLFSRIPNAADREGKLEEEDLYATVSVLIQGGHSTTMALLGRGLRGLCYRPGAADSRRPTTVGQLRARRSFARRSSQSAASIDSTRIDPANIAWS